jgi:hypothetical protein
MKTKLRPVNIRSAIWTAAVACIALSATLQAATNAPAANVSRSDSSISKDVHVYSIRFPGGRASDFFRFMRTNGFANDTILFAGEAGRVRIPEFTVSNVKLKEVAKSIEFVAEGELIVELVEMPEAGDGNVWRIKTKDTAAGQLKSKACALPSLFAGTKPEERIQAIMEGLYKTLIEGAYAVNRNEAQRPRGNITILESEKIVVAVGTEAYVEAIASALEAAERVAAAQLAEKKKPAE